MGDMKSMYTKLALYGIKNECARTDNAFFPISEVCNGTASLVCWTLRNLQIWSLAIWHNTLVRFLDPGVFGITVAPWRVTEIERKKETITTVSISWALVKCCYHPCTGWQVVFGIHLNIVLQQGFSRAKIWHCYGCFPSHPNLGGDEEEGATSNKCVLSIVWTPWRKVSLRLESSQ